jgi:nicotinate-nucleotide pyrophosphorylase (carboxylating)
MKPNPEYLDDLIKRALKEDLGPRDVTTEALISPAAKSQARIVAKSRGIIAGLFVAARVFKILDSRLRFQSPLKEGEEVKPGAVVARIAGPTRPLLMGERVALNFLGRLSGIATLTHQYVLALQGTKAKILDTRKTTPTLRPLEKYAVQAGGGKNYRWGLYDLVLIKDNHITAVGDIPQAVARARARWQDRYLIVVEVKNLKEVKAALNSSADRLMLDNMNLSQMKKAVALIDGRKEVEASGNMDLIRARKTARLGVDYISAGALTTKPAWLDLSLQFM